MPHSDQIVQLIRIARGLDRGGFYNAAKLFWAAAFSAEIHFSNQVGLPDGDELDQEIEAVIQGLTADGVGAALINAMQLARQGVRENRAIPVSQAPQVRVCRACGEIILGEPPQRCPACKADGLGFREFLPVYFLEPLSPPQALAALSSAPDEVEGLIAGLSEEQMAQPSRPGDWAVRNVLWHLWVTQELLSERVEIMLSENNPPLKRVAAWADENSEGVTAGEIVQRYRSSRQALVEQLSSFSAQDWWRSGQHEEFGLVTILTQASYFARHERSHYLQIEEIRQAILP
jgi:hypothetical protein